MRAETRHQLKEDRFSKATLQAAEKTVDWTVEHQSKLIVAAIAVIVLAARRISECILWRMPFEARLASTGIG